RRVLYRSLMIEYRQFFYYFLRRQIGGNGQREIGFRISKPGRKESNQQENQTGYFLSYHVTLFRETIFFLKFMNLFNGPPKNMVEQSWFGAIWLTGWF